VFVYANLSNTFDYAILFQKESENNYKRIK